MIDLKEVELLVEAGKLRNAKLLASTLNDKQRSGYIDIFTLTLFARNIVALDAIFHDEEVTPNESKVVAQNLAKWVNDNRDCDEWWGVGLLRLVNPQDRTVLHYDRHERGAQEEERKFRAAYAAIREKLNEPSRE